MKQLTVSQHDDFALALKQLKDTMANPLVSKEEIARAVSRLVRSKVAQQSYRCEELEDRILQTLKRCEVEPFTRHLRLNAQFVDTRVLLSEAGLPINRSFEARTGRILARWGYRKARANGETRYLAP